MKFAVLFDLALQMQRNGLGALLRDILTRQKSLIDASCLQNFVQVRGAGAVVTRSQAIDLQSEAVQMRCQTRYKIEFNNDFVTILVQALDRESTDVLTSEGLNQLLWLSVGIRQRTTSGPCSPNLMSWRTVTATVERAAGFEPA